MKQFYVLYQDRLGTRRWHIKEAESKEIILKEWRNAFGVDIADPIAIFERE